MCNYCKATFYCKATKYAKSFSAPLTRIESLRKELEDLTGEVYVPIPNEYCPMCGEKVKEVGVMNDYRKIRVYLEYAENNRKSKRIKSDSSRTTKKDEL